MAVPLPSAESLAHRARLSALVSNVKSRRMRTSIYTLQAHRIPTLWTLYRSLLRDAPSEQIRWRIREIFHQDKGLRLAGEVQRSLQRSHKWTELFAKAKQGDQRTRAILERYSRMIATKRDMAKWEQIIRDAIAWQKRLHNRPILTGSYLRPSLFNKPLPQMKPLPDHVSKMIAFRRRARERRQELFATLSSWRDDLRHERGFETMLEEKVASTGEEFERVFPKDDTLWARPLQTLMNEIVGSYRRETERINTPYPPEMLAQIKEARREKIRNKTRERERERRGEVLPRTLKRQRGGMPAHLWVTATPRQRHAFEVTRGVSEVGYVGKMKRAMGYKLRHGDTEVSKPLVDSSEKHERLNRLSFQISGENDRRREAQGESGGPV